MNRRNVLRSAALAPAFFQNASAQAAEVKNVIFMVADGMSPSVHPLAEEFSQLVRGRSTIWHDLLAQPNTVRGLFDMAALNSMVTDSSSASSSWSTGSRIFNAQVNVLPDGTKLTPIGHLVRDKGKRVGLVTTCTCTHATPAGFAAIEKSRDNEAGIGDQYRRVCDIVLGGGLKFFDPKLRKDKKDALAEFRADGFTICLNKTELQAATGARKILGLFADSHLPFTVDHQESAELKAAVPTLAEMATTALDFLDKSNSNGFLLQIEGGRVDHGAHNNDAAALLWDQLAFDDAVRVALDFAQRKGDTLVILCTDHGNSNPGLFGVGTEYVDSNKAFARLAGIKGSYVQLAKHFGQDLEYKVKPGDTLRLPDPREVSDIVKKLTNLSLTQAEAWAICEGLARLGPVNINKQFEKLAGILGQVFSNHTGIGWVGTSHTSDYVITTAVGPGAAQFAGLIKNTDVFPRLTRLMGFAYKNPAMDPATARKFAAFIPPRERADWA